MYTRKTKARAGQGLQMLQSEAGSYFDNFASNSRELRTNCQADTTISISPCCLLALESLGVLRKHIMRPCGTDVCIQLIPVANPQRNQQTSVQKEWLSRGIIRMRFTRLVILDSYPSYRQSTCMQGSESSRNRHRRPQTHASGTFKRLPSPGREYKVPLYCTLLTQGPWQAAWAVPT